MNNQLSLFLILFIKEQCVLMGIHLLDGYLILLDSAQYVSLFRLCSLLFQSNEKSHIKLENCKRQHKHWYFRC